jgi:uncharacterized membrane protein
MRKALPFVLIFVGGFLVIAAVVCLTWAPGQVEKTPLDTDNTTYLSGHAEVAGGADLTLEPTDVLGFSTSSIDSDASDGTVAVWTTSLCLVKDQGDITGCVDVDDPEGRLITAETDVFATDRHTAVTVNDAKYLPADATPQEGLQNKWPFNAEKKTYPTWDGLLGSTVDATYEGTEDVNGMETYHYAAVAHGEGVEVLDGVQGTYDATTDYYIEPRTGTIINQVVHQERVADGVGKILDLDLAFTDDQIQTNVDDTDDNLSQLTLIERTVPIVGLAVGIPVILIGFLLLVLGDRRQAAPAAETRATETAGV